jgi:hypothetical protein
LVVGYVGDYEFFDELIFLWELREGGGWLEYDAVEVS